MVYMHIYLPRSHMHAGMPCTYEKGTSHLRMLFMRVMLYVPSPPTAHVCEWADENLHLEPRKAKGGRQPEDPLFYSILFRWCWPSRPRARSQTAGRSQAPTHSPTHGFSTPSHIVNARLRTQTYLVWVRGKRQTVLTVMRNTCDDAYLPVRREDATHPSRFEES